MARPRKGVAFEQRGTIYTGVRLRDGRRRTWPVAQLLPPPTGVPLSLEWARIALARGNDVQRAWLAALLGVTPQRIRNLIAEGALVAKAVERGGEERALSPITHASAQQWLRARDPSKT